VVLSRPSRPLDSETIYLRAFELSDAEALTDLIVGGDISSYTAVSDEYDAAASKRWIAAQNEAWGQGRVLVLAIVDALGHDLVGKIELRRASAEEDAAEVGYFVAEPYRGSGVASEALGLLSGWAFEQGLLAMTARIAEDNAASRRVVEKAGFFLMGSQVEGHVSVEYWWKNRPARPLDDVLASLLAQ